MHKGPLAALFEQRLSGAKRKICTTKHAFSIAQRLSARRAGSERRPEEEAELGISPILLLRPLREPEYALRNRTSQKAEARLRQARWAKA
jgi:hypothetical protein